ncbi:MAG: aminoacyl-tRNA deacylase [Kiritimatiellia bacterium]|jgi:Cys-tRNA(Pro) deacylase
MTAAIRFLRRKKAEFEVHRYDYEDRGGTAQAAAVLGIDEHRIVKTIVLKNTAGRPLVMLQHGDQEISTKKLARALGEKSIELCERAEAERHSGYHCGGTSPFGFRRPDVPVYAQSTIFDLDWICINGGQRGLFVKIAPAALRTLLSATPVDAGQDA